MSPGNLLRSTSFRFFAWYAFIFGASVAVLLAIVYWTALATIDQQIRDSVDREMQVLIELYRGGTVERLIRAIQLRVVDPRPPRRYYLLQDAAGERIAGNLPPMKPDEGEMVLPASFLFPEWSLKTGDPGPHVSGHGAGQLPRQRRVPGRG
jgi:hypothetical protein